MTDEADRLGPRNLKKCTFTISLGIFVLTTEQKVDMWILSLNMREAQCGGEWWRRGTRAGAGGVGLGGGGWRGGVAAAEGAGGGCGDRGVGGKLRRRRETALAAEG